MKSPSMTKDYDSDIDIMRIIASFFVVMVHSSGISSFSGIFYNSASRFSVPVFVIISGSYMLSRKTDVRYLARKSGRLLLLMITCSGVYYIYGLLSGVNSYNGIAGLLTYLTTEPVHLWYIYAIIALYIFTPIFYVFCNNATRKEYLYALILTFLFGSVAVIAVRSTYFPLLSVIIDKMKVAYTLGFAFLYLLGGYLRKFEIQNKTYICSYILGIAGTVVTIAGTLMLSGSNANNDLLLSFFAPCVLMASTGFYLFIKRTYLRHPIKSKKARSVLHNAADCTLGIYILHPLIIMVLQNNPPFYLSEIPSYIAIPLRTALVFILAAAVASILTKIPGLKRFL